MNKYLADMRKVRRNQILQNYRTRSLLESTRKIIARQGFDAVTMERVASEAGITKGGIYLYFRNKDQMIMAAIEEIAAEMVRAIQEGIDPDAPPWEQLCQLVRAQLQIMERNRDLLRTLLLDRRLLSDSPRGKRSRRLLKYRELHEKRIRAILTDGEKRGLFEPVDGARAAFYITEMATSTAQKRLLGLTRSSLQEETRGLIRFLSLLLRRKSRPSKRAGRG